VTAPPQPVLAIATQPASSATAGVALDPQPVIQLRAASGADLATAGVAVSVAIATGGGTLSGTTTVSTDGQGRAVFTDLVINGDPGTRTLVFTAPGFASATSGDIAVQAAPPPAPDAALSTVTVNPASVALGVSSTITVTVRDRGGNPVASRGVSVDVSGTNNTITGSPATTGPDGVATVGFSSTTAESKTVTATSDGVTLGTPQTIVVTP